MKPMSAHFCKRHLLQVMALVVQVWGLSTAAPCNGCQSYEETSDEVAPLEFNQLVPQLRTTTLGGSITLQCPCSYDDQTWCIAGGSLSLGPMTLAPPLDGVTELNLDSASCQDNSESSIRIGNVQPFMDRAMVYCAQQCNDPLKIVGQTTILRTAAEFGQLVPELHPIALGGNVSLQCPCQGLAAQTWCVASKTIGPLSLLPPLDGVTELSLESAQCQGSSSTASSIVIGNIQEWMNGAMVYCARACNDPLTIIGGANVLRIPESGDTAATESTPTTTDSPQ